MYLTNFTFEQKLQREKVLSNQEKKEMTFEDGEKVFLYLEGIDKTY